MASPQDRLRADVTMLATTIGARHVGAPDALERSAAWIETRLADATGRAVTREPYACGGVTVRNVYVELPGTVTPGEVVVIGAHYDSVPGCPGANDNGSAVAAMLELAARCARRPHARTVRFVAFVNEEPPFFQSPQMGSLVHAAGCEARGEKVIGMVALETIGCFSDAPGSQRYPDGAPAGLPTTGNFISVVADTDRAAFGARVAEAMRASGAIPVESAALPATVPGVGWSDHWSFWQHGFDAVMVTDTAPFRYAHYHRATDTPDKLDYARMAKVVDAAEAAIAAIAGVP